MLPKLSMTFYWKDREVGCIGQMLSNDRMRGTVEIDIVEIGCITNALFQHLSESVEGSSIAN